MKKTKTQKGITLIALIITIVVLMVLAAVAISSIQNDGIIGHAQNATNKFTEEQKKEESFLQDYEDMLIASNGGYKTYSIGEEVTITVDGETHNFYVIEDKTSEGKVVLLAKGNIHTQTLKQENANTVEFSTEPYWTGEVDIIKETFPIPASHTAAKAAYDYGIKVGGKGKLMTITEADNLVGTDFSTKLFETCFWLGSSLSDEKVYYTDIWASEALDWPWYDSSTVGVRPVVEISKSKLDN